MQNIAIIRQGTGRYLFSLPDNVTLKEGDRVKCSTRRGITDGVAFADSAWVDENVSQLIGKLTGAKFPLKPVVGKLEYLPFEKPEDKPTEPTEQDKQEPVKLYCVKDFASGSTLTGGKTYYFVDGRIKYDGGQTSSWHKNAKEFCEAVNENTGVDLIFPLVKRPAKVGEWVLLDCSDCFGKNKGGDIAKVVGAPSHTTAFCFISDPTREYSGGICVCFKSDYSYVLDGYRAEAEPEPEAEPEYFSGKVVCVSSGDNCFAVGKMYEFVNGEIKDGEGDERPIYTEQRFKSVDEWNSEYGMPIARFIEFKGEAHD